MSTDTVGGVWRYTADLARVLDAEIVVVTLGTPATPAQRRELGDVRVVTLDHPLDWLAPDRTAIDAAARALRDLADRERCDVRLLHAPALARAGGPCVSVLHSDVATWWDAVHGGALPDDLAWRARATWQGCEASDAVIAVSRGYAQATQSHVAAELSVVLNGTPALASADHLSREAMVLTAGRLWDAAKGARTLDEAAAGLGWPVVMAGALDAGAGRAFAPRHATHAGALAPPALRALMGRARIYASAALYEPFGLSVLEAAQSGMVLVLSDIATHRELWSGAAVFVPATDVAAWRRTLAGLLADPGRCDALAAAARARAEHYPIAATAADTWAVLRSVVRAPACA